MAWKVKNLFSAYSHRSGGQLGLSWLGRVLLGNSDSGWGDSVFLAAGLWVNWGGSTACISHPWMSGLPGACFSHGSSHASGRITRGSMYNCASTYQGPTWVTSVYTPLPRASFKAELKDKRWKKKKDKRGENKFRFFGVDLPSSWQGLRIGANNSI